MDKHFEPVTARSLATRIIKTIGLGAYFEDQIEAIIEPHIRKPSDENKSVPERCEEAYNEAMELLNDWFKRTDDEATNSLLERTAILRRKSNPFKEADIVKEDETEPKLYPFDLGLAAQGHKVVTRDGRDAKVVAEGLKGVTPICAVITDHDGSKTACLLTLKGKLVDHKENPEDLFILKEPEPIRFEVYMRDDGEIFVNIIGAYQVAGLTKSPENMKLIKTITTTI